MIMLSGRGKMGERGRMMVRVMKKRDLSPLLVIAVLVLLTPVVPAAAINGLPDGAITGR
jgi:hypothetical protein